jgi:hypothetical protein
LISFDSTNLIVFQTIEEFQDLAFDFAAEFDCFQTRGAMRGGLLPEAREE